MNTNQICSVEAIAQIAAGLEKYHEYKNGVCSNNGKVWRREPQNAALLIEQIHFFLYEELKLIFRLDHKIVIIEQNKIFGAFDVST